MQDVMGLRAMVICTHVDGGGVIFICFLRYTLDEASSRLRMRHESKPTDIEKLDQEIVTLRVEQEALKRDSGLGLIASMV